MRAAVHAVLHHQDARDGAGTGDRAIGNQRPSRADLGAEPAWQRRDVPDRAAGRSLKYGVCYIVLMNRRDFLGGAAIAGLAAARPASDKRRFLQARQVTK